jgi:hypothetical protein
MSDGGGLTLDAVEALDGFLGWFVRGRPRSREAAVAGVEIEELGLGCRFSRPFDGGEEGVILDALWREVERYRRYALVAQLGVPADEPAGPRRRAVREIVGASAVDPRVHRDVDDVIPPFRAIRRISQEVFFLGGSRSEAQATLARVAAAGFEATLHEGIASRIRYDFAKRQRVWQIKTGRIEQLLRPGVLSEAGFLGPDERLADVLARDANTLAALGVEPALIARRIREIVSVAIQRQEEQFQAELRRLRSPAGAAPQPAGDDTQKGKAPRRGFAVENFWVSTMHWKGYQPCPWECDPDPHWGSLDFRIDNCSTGASFKGPGLIVHLIERHGFFEGLESPYRVDPADAVEVLELGPVDPAEASGGDPSGRPA